MPDSKSSLPDEARETPAPEANETPELEFRPWVLWTGVGSAGVISLGLLVFTYVYCFKQGYAQGHTEGDVYGFNRAIEHQLVHENLSKTAEQNVLAFTRLSSASDETLLQAAADAAKTFAWIRNDEVRLEAEWYLVDALLQRNIWQNATGLLDSLVGRVPHTPEWTHRVFRAASLISAQNDCSLAVKYYQKAAELAAEAGLPELRENALGCIVANDLANMQPSAQVLEALKNRYTELKALGEDTRQLRSLLMVHMAELYRAKGNQAAAEKLYRTSLEGVDLAAPLRPEYAAAYGVALLELGDIDAAGGKLRQAADSAGSRPVEVAARLLALRHLAALETARGQEAVALTLLQRAHGVAEGRVHPDNTFWPCLFDQRGWLQFIGHQYEAALQDFQSALAHTEDPLLQIQPLEGAGRCLLEQSQPEPARVMIEKCIALRQQHARKDSSAMGRLNLLLGQIFDQQNMTTEAEAAYAAAINALNSESPVDQDNRLMALLGRAHALTQLRRWPEAHATWEQLVPLLGDQPDRREEARNQLRRIKSYLPGEGGNEEAAPVPQ